MAYYAWIEHWRSAMPLLSLDRVGKSQQTRIHPCEIERGRAIPRVAIQSTLLPLIGSRRWGRLKYYNPNERQV